MTFFTADIILFLSINIIYPACCTTWPERKKEHDKSTFPETTEWEEKIRKYTSVDLHHYNYRGVKSWYVFLKNPNKERNIAIFAPEYSYNNADEKTKREVLEFYGKLFDLPTNYYDLEASYASSQYVHGMHRPAP